MFLAINVTWAMAEMNRKVKKFETTGKSRKPWYDSFVRVYGSQQLRQDRNVPMIIILELDLCRRALSESKQIDDERFRDEVQHVEGAIALFQVSCAAKR